jgi:hypothetical protein
LIQRSRIHGRGIHQRRDHETRHADAGRQKHRHRPVPRQRRGDVQRRDMVEKPTMLVVGNKQQRARPAHPVRDQRGVHVGHGRLPAADPCGRMIVVRREMGAVRVFWLDEDDRGHVLLARPVARSCGSGGTADARAAPRRQVPATLRSRPANASSTQKMAENLRSDKHTTRSPAQSANHTQEADPAGTAGHCR